MTIQALIGSLILTTRVVYQLKVSIKEESNLMYIDTKKKYLIAACWNTVFGYSSSVYLYYLLKNIFNTITIVIVANIITISMSFIVHKFLVFNSKGNWLVEYLRCYLVYGVSSFFGISILWFLVDFYHMKYWIAQGVAIIIMGIFTYVSHSRFTFNIKP